MKLGSALIMTLFIVFWTNSSFGSDGHVVFSKGKVWINGKLAKQKQSFNYGDVVKTGIKSLAVLKIKPASRVKLKAKTSLQIKKPKINGQQIESSYLLKFGEIFVKAKKTKLNSYKIKVKNAVLGVRGTQFFVSYASKEKKKRDVWMCVNEGVVEVSMKKVKETVLVKAGEGIVINSNKLPEVKQYEWTKELNWKMKGSYKELKDTTNIQNINYDLESFDYD